MGDGFIVVDMKKISVLPVLLFGFFVVLGTSGWAQTYTNGDWTYTLNSSNQARITEYNGPGGTVAIPSTINGFPVKSIGGVPNFLAYGNYNVVSSITIPEGVSNIEDWTFHGLASLTNVIIPNSVTNIGVLAFAQCSALTNITIPNGVNSIGSSAFTGCTNIETFAIGNGITNIPNYFFSGMAKLRKVNIGTSVSNVGDFAFSGCSQLNSVYFMGNAPSAGSLVFYSILPVGYVYYLAEATGWQSTFAEWPTRALSGDTDSDGDTLSDAAEVALAELGFDWQITQNRLVDILFANADQAALYSRAQYDANYGSGVSAGIDTVLSNPANYNLYTSNSIMDLRMGGLMLQKEGSNAVVTFQPQTTTDLATQPFTNNGTAITNTIPMPGNKGFIRINAKPQ